MKYIFILSFLIITACNKSEGQGSNLEKNFLSIGTDSVTFDISQEMVITPELCIEESYGRFDTVYLVGRIPYKNGSRFIKYDTTQGLIKYIIHYKYTAKTLVESTSIEDVDYIETKEVGAYGYKVDSVWSVNMPIPCPDKDPNSMFSCAALHYGDVEFRKTIFIKTYAGREIDVKKYYQFIPKSQFQ